MIEGRAQDAVITPEAISLTLDVAGVGSRMIAVIIDTAIQAGAILLLTLLFWGGGGVGTTAVVTYVILVFLIYWGYYPLIEGATHGRTPGKRAQGLRVIRTDGQPVGWGPVLIRNLLRTVDALPGIYAVGVVSMVLSRRSQRLGDLAAGTLVIRERALTAPVPILTGAQSAGGVRLDTTGLGNREYEMVRSFLERRNDLQPAARAALAGQLAGALRTRMGGTAASSLSDEPFLEVLALSYRGRFAGDGQP